MVKTGTRLQSQVCDTQVIVVRSSDSLDDLRAGGVPMIPLDAEKSADVQLDPAFAGGTVMGKRYVDEAGAELLVTKAGAGSLSIGTTRWSRRPPNRFPPATSRDAMRRDRGQRRAHPRPGHGLPVPDPARVWPVLQRSKPALADLGAHYVLVYVSTRDAGRVMVTMSLRSKEPILEVLRSRIFLDWFDSVGLQDIPAIFAGETVEKIAVSDPDPHDAPGVIMATIARVDDLPTLISRIRATLHASRTPESGTCGCSGPSTTSTKRWCSRRSTPRRMPAAGSTTPTRWPSGWRVPVSEPTRRSSSGASHI